MCYLYFLQSYNESLLAFGKVVRELSLLHVTPPLQVFLPGVVVVPVPTHSSGRVGELVHKVHVQTFQLLQPTSSHSMINISLKFLFTNSSNTKNRDKRMIER